MKGSVDIRIDSDEGGGNLDYATAARAVDDLERYIDSDAKQLAEAALQDLRWFVADAQKRVAAMPPDWPADRK